MKRRSPRVDDPANAMCEHLRARQRSAVVPGLARYHGRAAEQLVAGELVVQRWRLPVELAGAGGGAAWVRFAAGTVEAVEPVWCPAGPARRIAGWRAVVT